MELSPRQRDSGLLKPEVGSQLRLRRCRIEQPVTLGSHRLEVRSQELEVGESGVRSPKGDRISGPSQRTPAIPRDLPRSPAKMGSEDSEAEVGSRKSGVRSQESGVRSQKWGIRSQKPEGGPDFRPPPANARERPRSPAISRDSARKTQRMRRRRSQITQLSDSPRRGDRILTPPDFRQMMTTHVYAGASRAEGWAQGVRSRCFTRFLSPQARA